MLFSLIVPVYKVENYLCQCVDSVLSQSFQDFELILVDDGSPDSCPQICDDYARKNARVKVIHKPNGGVVSARKAGVNAAGGEYVLCIDSDDYIQPGLLSQLERTIRTHCPDAVCYNYIKFFDGPGGREIVDTGGNKYQAGLYTDGELDVIRASCFYDGESAHLNWGNLVYTTWSKAVKRDLYIDSQNKVPDTVRLGEDLVFSLNLLENCKSLFILDTVGYAYRENPDSITHTYTDDDIRRVGALLAEVDRIAEIQPLYEPQVPYYALNMVRCAAVGYGTVENSCSSYVKLMRKQFDRKLCRRFLPLRIKDRTLGEAFFQFACGYSAWRLLFCYAHLFRQNG